MELTRVGLSMLAWGGGGGGIDQCDQGSKSIAKNIPIFKEWVVAVNGSSYAEKVGA